MKNIRPPKDDRLHFRRPLYPEKRRKVFNAVLGLVASFLIGCSQGNVDSRGEYLIRIDDQVVTVEDFQKMFENVKGAYPHSMLRDPQIIKVARLRLLNQLTEELIILKRAQELQIEVSESELEQAVADYKQDYPEGVFDEILLEQAVSYPFWRQRLKIRLLMEKVIARDMGERITITPDEISDYYNKQYPKESLGAEDSGKDKNIDAAIVEHLRRKKAEAAYKSWLKELQKKYTVEINEAQWKRLAG